MPVQSLSQNTIIGTVHRALENYPEVAAGYLFGSHVEGDTGPLSDIDVAVYFMPKTPLEARDMLGGRIRDSLERALRMPGKVDFVILNDELPPALERAVVYEGKLIYEHDADTRARYEAEVIGRWLDYKPHHDKLMAEILAG